MQNLTNENERQPETISAPAVASSYAEALWRRMKGQHPVIVLIALLILAGTWREAQASVGQLDPTFGSGGKVTIQMAAQLNDVANAVAVQPDGKIIVGGYIDSTQSTNSRAVLLRLNSDGSLDQSFGNGGKVINNMQLHLNGIALQPDGKILTAGGITGAHPINFGLVRYNTDGSLDQSFGSGGFATIGPQSFTVIQSDAQALILQPDGKIVVVGYMTIYPNGDKFAVARFNTDGSLDQSFGTNGSYITTTSQNDRALAVALQSDGKIVASGYATTAAATRDFALARYNANGSPDLNFGIEGKLTTNFSFRNFAHAYGVIVQPDGMIVAVGGFTKFSDGFLLARYDSAGRLDQGFGQGGRVTTTFGSGSGSGQAAMLQPDGKIIVAGSVSYNGTGNEAVVLARYNPNGSFDQNFGSNGFLITDFDAGTLDEARALALQSNGKLVLAGYASEPSGSYTDFALARYTIGPPRPAACDFDGDSRTDFSVFRPGDGFWYSLRQTGQTAFTQFGLSGDIPVPGDFDGDGKADICVWRESTGTFYVLRSSTNTFQAQQWGQSGDDPTVTRDYDGDGLADFAVYRRGATSSDASNWYILQSSNNTLRAAQWGLGSDLPAPGDYDGDGKADLSVKRNGTSPDDAAFFYTLLSASNTLSAAQWGIGSDRSVPGDYDGDGKTDLAVWRPANGTFYVIKSSDGGVISSQWGLSTDRPVPGDYDSDGKTDFAVWRPSDGTFYVLKSSGGFIAQQWGIAGDIPVAFYGVH